MVHLPVLTTIYACHKSGWRQTDIFKDWFQHFIDFTHSTEQKPVLLILDGHSTHTKNFDVIDLARKSHVHILCFPSHCTHRLQPLNVSYMRPPSQNYDEAMRIWLRNHPGRVVTIHQVASLFGIAYLKSATAQTAVSRFRATGISPFNRAIFTDDDFVEDKLTNGTAPEFDPTVDEGAIASTSKTSTSDDKFIGPAEIATFPCVTEARPTNRARALVGQPQC